MDRLLQMQTLVSVAEEGSLARAALRHGVSATIMGRRIDALEKRLGLRLMHRSTRQLRFTEAGMRYLEDCKRLLAELDQIEQAVTHDRDEATGHLIVSAPAAFGRKHVAVHAPGFLARHPRVRLSFNLTDRVVDLVREGYHMGIRIGGAVDPNFVALRLAANRRVVCATPDYLARHGTPMQLEDLARHHCLAFNLQGGQQRGWYFSRNGKPVSVKVNGPLDCNDGELLLRWCLEGLGLGWRSTWEIQRELAEGRLVTVLDDFALDDYDILAVYPQQAVQPAKVRLFVAWLREVWNAPGYWSRGNVEC